MHFRFFFISINLSYSQNCIPGAFDWDDGNGNRQIVPVDAQLEAYTLNAGGALGITFEIIDPNNLNADSGFTKPIFTHSTPRMDAVP